MHLGDMVTVDRRKIFLKPELLTPLHIKTGSVLYGLHYPPSLSRIEVQYSKYVYSNDFMFTPLPPRLWYSVAKFTIYVNHLPGCIAALTDLLKRHNINIITADSTRSGHRCIYMTLTLEFVELSDENDDVIYNPTTSNKSFIEKQRTLNDLIKSTKNMLEVDGKDYIFNPNHGMDLYGGVDASSVHSLHYFYDKVSESKEKRILKATVEKNILKLTEADWYSVFENQEKDHIPTYGFAATSTRDISMRISLLPKDDLQHFKKFEIGYSRGKVDSGNKTSKGVMAIVTSQLAAFGYNIWSLNNSTIENKPNSEQGKIEVIVQDINRLNKEHDHCHQMYEEYKNKNVLPKNVKINTPKVTRHIRTPIFVSVKSRDEKARQYYNNLCEAGKKFGLLKEDFVLFDSSKSTKESIVNDILETMTNCTCMIQIHNVESKDDKTASVWMQAESLLAQSMKMAYYILVHNNLKSDLSINLDYTHFFSATLMPKDYEDAIRSVLEQEYGKIIYD